MLYLDIAPPTPRIFMPAVVPLFPPMTMLFLLKLHLVSRLIYGEFYPYSINSFI